MIIERRRMDRLDLGTLFLHFLVLWFVAVGGPSAILPDIHRYIVEVRHLMTSAQFAELYTLAQVAPGQPKNPATAAAAPVQLANRYPTITARLSTFGPGRQLSERQEVHKLLLSEPALLLD